MGRHLWPSCAGQLNFAPKGWAQCNGQFLPINQKTQLRFRSWEPPMVVTSTTLLCRIAAAACRRPGTDRTTLGQKRPLVRDFHNHHHDEMPQRINHFGDGSPQTADILHSATAQAGLAESFPPPSSRRRTAADRSDSR